MLNFGKIRVFRDDDNPDKNGSGSGDKILGKFGSQDELVKSYTEIESEKGRLANEVGELRNKLREHEESGRRAKTEEAASSAIKEAQSARDKFDSETEWASLRGKELAEATRKLSKLDDAVEAAKEAHSKVKGKATEESVRRQIIDEISRSDATEATKLANQHKIPIAELEEFAKKNDTGTYVEAAYRYLYEKQAAEIKRLQKIEESVTKGREHLEPERQKEPANPKDGKFSREDIIKRAGELPTAKAFREALQKQ